MTFNRTIKLTKPLRQEIARAVQQAWLREHPRPSLDLPPTGPQLALLDAWREGRDRVYTSVLAVLETFTSVNQLDELWPEILPFVAAGLLDPSRHFTLPRAA